MWNELREKDLAAISGGDRPDGLTMAIVTEVYPMPPGVYQPGVVGQEPFPCDPWETFTVVIWHR